LKIAFKKESVSKHRIGATMKEELYKLPENRSLPDKISHHIKGLILSGDLAPGTRLTETELSESMGVSRGRVREAFHILEEQGLVHSSRYKGRWVAELSSEEASELYEIRRLLEGYAFELVVERITPGTIERMQDTIDEMSEALQDGDLTRASRKDFDFHRIIWESSENSLLCDILHNIQDKLLLLLIYDLTEPSNIDEWIHTHQDLIDKLEGGDKEGALLSLQTSLQSCRNSVIKRMRINEMTIKENSEK
jgi:DNA-binding GntR family transcriptional regulator